MKVMLINGSPHEKGCTYTALMECAKTLHEAGIETELFGSAKSLFRAVWPAEAAPDWGAVPSTIW